MLEDQLKLKQLQNKIDEIIKRQNNLSEHIEILTSEFGVLQKSIESKSIPEKPKEILPIPAAMQDQEKAILKEEIVLEEEMVDQLAVSNIKEKSKQDLFAKKPETIESKIASFTAKQKLDSEFKVKKRPPPDETTGVDKVINFVVKFFSEGNPVVRVGMVVLFFGLSFLVMYAANKGYFPIEFRLSLVGAIAITLIGLGWKTRDKEGGYGLVLQGGGIAGLYLTLFAASKFYFVLPLKLTFALMFVVVICSVILAVIQNAQVLALMATAGGFLAPILTSDGSNNYVGLFAFYLLLNIGILSVAWFKTWRLLNWVGFMFTFVIFSIWALSDYQPADYYSTQPFLIAYFSMYLAIAVLFSIKQPPNLRGVIDGSLIFGMPITGFGLQVKLLNHTEYGLACSAFVLCVVYISLAIWIRKKYIQTHRNLFESFIALGVTFGTLTIPLAFDYKWTSASWAIESVGLIWVGLRQKHLRPRIVGLFLYVGSVVSLLMDGWFSSGTIPFITGDFFSILIFSVSALCIGYFYFQNAIEDNQPESGMSYLAMVIGWVWWLGAGLLVLCGYLVNEILFSSILAFFSLSCFLFSEASKRTQWKYLNHFQNWNLPLGAILSLLFLGTMFDGESNHPAKPLNLLALIFFIAIQYLFLWKQKNNEKQELPKLFHIGTAWFVIGLLFWEAAYRQDLYALKGNDCLMLWFGCFTLPLILLMVITKTQKWPFLQYQSQFKNQIPIPLIGLSAIWFIFASSISGTDYFYYAPILNPIDLAMLGVIVIAVAVFKNDFLSLRNTAEDFRYGIVGVSIFFWLNVVLLRAINFYVDVAYSIDVQWTSSIVQVAISILWTLCALVVMHISRKISNRELWKVGGILLAVVVIKLLSKDLSDIGGLERIISFIAVGGLMLLIGYIAPIPPKKIKGTTSKEEANNESIAETIEDVNQN